MTDIIEKISLRSIEKTSENFLLTPENFLYIDPAKSMNNEILSDVNLIYKSSNKKNVDSMKMPHAKSNRNIYESSKGKSQS